MRHVPAEQIAAINANLSGLSGELACPNCDGVMYEDADDPHVRHCGDCGLIEIRD
jgi:hypothetical protein